MFIPAPSEPVQGAKADDADVGLAAESAARQVPVALPFGAHRDRAADVELHPRPRREAPLLLLGGVERRAAVRDAVEHAAFGVERRDAAHRKDADAQRLPGLELDVALRARDRGLGLAQVAVADLDGEVAVELP